ncbi:MAG: serine/threonine-protein kinase [Cyanobacteria bacterium J06635_10]
MSYCLNPHCQKPQNHKDANSCLTCGNKLLLKERYRAIKPIGKGGFGRTLLAVDESKLLKPPCVIKQFLLQAQGTNNIQKAAELFQQEVLRLDNLGKHSQIPNLFDYFTQESHQYLVQEYIDGYDLAQILAEQGTFKEAQTWELLNSLLPVLEFIHTHDVIHRDIKPQNIIRSRNGKLYLVDFGAAKVVTGTAILQTGTSIGTPEFVAPEQSRGKATYSSDLYSLGTTCIYLLTGISPFDLFDISEFTWVWREYLIDNPVSDKLSNILDKLIENATSRRYQSVNEVLKDIEVLNIKIKSLNYSSWRCINTLTDRNSSINSIVISPDGNFIVSGSDDCKIKLWEVNTGKIFRILNNENYCVYAVAISSDGLIIASGDYFNNIELWNVNYGKKIRTLKGHKGVFSGVNSLSFSPDSKILASAGGDKTVKLWNVSTGEEIRTLKGHKKWVSSVAISPDGKFIVSGSADKTAIIWDLNTGIKLHKLPYNPIFTGVNSVAFSPDGQVIVAAGEDNTIKLWKVITGEEICTLNTEKWVRYVTFSPNGEILAISTYKNDITLYDIKTKQEICTLTGHSGKVNSLVFSPDGRTLFSGGEDRNIKVWRCE